MAGRAAETGRGPHGACRGSSFRGLLPWGALEIMTVAARMGHLLRAGRAPSYRCLSNSFAAEGTEAGRWREAQATAPRRAGRKAEHLPQPCPGVTGGLCLPRGDAAGHPASCPQEKRAESPALGPQASGGGPRSLSQEGRSQPACRSCSLSWTAFPPAPSGLRTGLSSFPGPPLTGPHLPLPAGPCLLWYGSRGTVPTSELLHVLFLLPK